MQTLFNLIKKQKIFCLVSLAFFSVIALIPEQAFAFVGTGIFDYFDAALGAVEETTGPVIRSLITVFVLYGIGWVALFLSSTGVDHLLNHPEYLYLKGNTLVEAGWNFTSGLANLFIIILFVIVALSFILKWEKFEPKKAIVRLIVAALLVNFSFLFCQILVDVSNILIQSFTNLQAGGGGNIAQALSASAMQASGNQINALLTYLVGITLSCLTVMLGPVAQVGFIMLLGVSFLPNVLTFFMQLGISFLLASVFFMYFTVLLLRIAIVQILTIVAPLAVICFVLPQTKKLGQQWLDGLIHWGMFAVPLSFFLMLATYILEAPVQMSLESDITNGSGFLFTNLDQLGQFFAINFLLFIFLVVALIISKKMIPKEATELIEEAKRQSKYFAAPISKVGKSMGYATGRGTKEWLQKGREQSDLIDQYRLDPQGNAIEGWEEKYESDRGEVAPRWFRGGYRKTLDNAFKGQLTGKGIDGANVGARDLEAIVKGGLLYSGYSGSDTAEIMSKMKSSELQKVFEGGNLSEKEKDRMISYAEKLSLPEREKITRTALGSMKRDESGSLVRDEQMANRVCSRLLGPKVNTETLVGETSENQVADISANALKQEKFLKTAFTSWDGRNFAEAAKDKDKFEIINKNIAAHHNIIESKNLRAKKYFTSQTSLYNYPTADEAKNVKQVNFDQSRRSDFTAKERDDSKNQESGGHRDRGGIENEKSNNTGGEAGEKRDRGGSV